MFFQPKKQNLFLLFLLCISASFYGQEVIEHTVQYGETKYRLSKMYDISIEELEKQNPQIVNGLYAGQKLTINTSGSQAKNETPNEPKETGLKYLVKPGDTKFSISQKHHITVAELEAANPEIVSKLLADTYITIPGAGQGKPMPVKNTPVEPGVKETNNENPSVVRPKIYTYDNLMETLKTADNKAIAFLYPEDFAKNNELSDFKKGTQVALDSLKSIGVNVAVTHIVITAMKSEDLIALESSDALISLCEFDCVEKIRSKLKANTPVVYAKSMSTKEIGPSASDYFARSTPEFRQKLILDYLYGKGNIVLVNGEGDASELLTHAYQGIKILNTDQYGTVNEAGLTALLDSDKTNYIILNTTDTNTIINTTNTLLHQSGKFKIQLASFNTDTDISSDKVSNKRYMVLKLIFPQFEGYLGENGSTASPFYTRYKRSFKASPPKEAVAGFDLTFDLMIRLFQDQSFKELSGKKTRRVNTAFLYKGGVQNAYVNEAMRVYQLTNQNTASELN